jgi:hypothetical protein
MDRENKTKLDILGKEFDKLQEELDKLHDLLNGSDDETDDKEINKQRQIRKLQRQINKLRKESDMLNDLAVKETESDEKFKLIHHIQKNYQDNIIKLESEIAKINTKEGGRKKTRKYNKNKRRKSRKRK